MYPSLTAVGSSSRWYSKKNTAQDKLSDIISKEELLAEKRQKAFKVGATVLVRGKPVDPALISTIRDQEDNRGVSDEIEAQDNRSMVLDNMTDHPSDDMVIQDDMRDQDGLLSNGHDEINDFFNNIQDEREEGSRYSQYDDNYSTPPS